MISLDTLITFHNDELQRSYREMRNFLTWLEVLSTLVGGEVQVSNVDIRSAYKAGETPKEYAERLAKRDGAK